MAEKLSIFKIGGFVIDDMTELDYFLKDFASIQSKKMLVHGGGKWVSKMSQKLGLDVNMIEGRRITDAETLEVVKMMLPGVANKNIVAILQKYKCNALGFTGADGGLILARRRPPIGNIDYGYVGDIVNVKAKKLSEIIDLSYTPVFTALTHDGMGQLLNTNADTIASSMAIELSKYYETELYYCLEKPGVLFDINNDNSVIKVLTRSVYNSYRHSGAIHSGMIPKIDNAFDALDKGVAKIHICHYKDIGRVHTTKPGIGTLIIDS